MSTNPLINGVVYDHSSIEINIKGVRFLQCTEIEYSDTLEPGKLRGAAAKVLATTRGEYSAEGSFSLSKQDGQQLISDLGQGFKAKSFPVTLNYAEAGMDFITDTLRGCRITKVEASSSGTDATMLKFSIHIMNILWNGVDSTGEPGNLGTGVKL